MAFVTANFSLLYASSISLFICCLIKVNSEKLDAAYVHLPNISLERYRDETLKKWITIEDESSIGNFIVKNEDVLSVVPSDKITATHILLVCRAPYPIYWNSTGVYPTDLDEISTGFKVEYTENSTSSNSTKEFLAFLELCNEESFTGLYTCQSVESSNLVSSTYVFLSGITSQSKVLLQAGEDITVGLNGQQSIMLPCKVSQPSAVVQLAKQNVHC